MITGHRHRTSMRPTLLALLAAATMLGTLVLSVGPVLGADPAPNVGLGKNAKQGPDRVNRVNVTDQYRYVIVVWNRGDALAEDVTVIDDLDDDLEIVETFWDVDVSSHGGIGSCDVAPGNVVTCNLDDLAAENDGKSDSGFIRIVVRPSEPACDGSYEGVVSNQASVSAGNEPPVRQGDNTSRIVNVTVNCDLTAPTMTTRPGYAFRANSRLRTSNVPVRIGWEATDDAGGSGVAEYRLQHRIGTGTWRNVTLRNPLATQKLMYLAPRKVQQFRAQARDSAGNWSAWRTGPRFKVRAIQESSARIDYDGTWARHAKNSFYGGAVRHANDTGDSASITFIGRQFAWVTTRGPNRGVAEVYVDGALVATIDLARARERTRLAVFTLGWGSSATHTVRIEIVGGDRVDVDAFLVANQ